MRIAKLIGLAFTLLGYAAVAQGDLLSDIMPPMGKMPTNDDKKYEYAGEFEANKAASGELESRLNTWLTKDFDADAKVKELKVELAEGEEQEGEVILVQISTPLPEAHFNVKRKHSNRVLTYNAKFEMEKKDLKYSFSEINYGAREEYPKGVEDFNVPLETFKSPTSISVREELDRYFVALLEEMKQAANKEVAGFKPQKKSKKPASKQKETTPQKEESAPQQEETAPQQEQTPDKEMKQEKSDTESDKTETAPTEEAPVEKKKEETESPE